MLCPQHPPIVPEETRRVARAAFPKGTLCLRIADALGPVYQDSQFMALFPRRGQPAEAPGRLALAVVLQFMENLSDREAADAVRGRIDWKYVLGLALTDPGFDHTVLSEFRTRLLAGDAGLLLLDSLLQRLQEQGLVKARGRQRTDSTHTVVSLRQPDTIDDPLTAVLRSGARRLLAQAIEAEADAFLAAMKGERLPDGRERVVRHGHGPERQVQTGIGPVEVQRPKLRDRAVSEAGADRIRFTSAILPRWSRRTRSLDALLPILYLRGVSMGDFQEALGALLGKEAPNLSPSVVARLRGEWEADYARWQRRDLSARRYVYIWADGVYLQARMEPQAECMLVLIGATPEGKKELLGFQVGVRESAQSWRELLVDLKARGLTIAPELATGDGALGFWKALDEVSPTTRHQRCTVHKTANVLDKMPKSVQPAAKSDLREIWAAPDRATAEAATATFAEKYGAKYEKAVTCLVKDRDALLTFYDFPAEHWDHLRTSNPIESVFATVRHRTVRTKGALSQDTARLMVFKLVMAASKTWHKLKGENQLPKVVQGVTFRNGVEVTNTPAQDAA